MKNSTENAPKRVEYCDLLSEKIKGAEIDLEKIKKRSLELRDEALRSEESGDSESCWFFMAARAEMKRSIIKLSKTIANLKSKLLLG